MRVRRYVVKKLEEAKPAILRDLGKDAIIISTNKVKAKGLKGFFGKYHFEVLAAADNNTSTPSQAKSNTKTKPKPRPMTNPKPNPEPNSEPNLIQSHYNEDRNLELDIIRKELRENQKLLQNVLSDIGSVASQFPPGYEELYKKLLSQGITELKAKKLISKLKNNTKDNNDPEVMLDALREIMIHEVDGILKIQRDELKYSTALVGPTGVGKTTTLAKIAAHTALNHQKSIGFITLDNYRIAAAEQLKIYGDILDVPVVVANTISEYTEAITELKDKDQIFIDTAGRSHKNTKQLTELKGYFDTISLDQTILVFSITTNYRDLLPIYNTYKLFEPKGIILSKLDEVESYGNIYNVLTEFGLPILYFTTGQNVPEDIVTLNSEQIVSKILDNHKGESND